jgi:hypothetical protein
MPRENEGDILLKILFKVATGPSCAHGGILYYQAIRLDDKVFSLKLQNDSSFCSQATVRKGKVTIESTKSC